MRIHPTNDSVPVPMILFDIMCIATITEYKVILDNIILALGYKEPQHKDWDIYITKPILDGVERSIRELWQYQRVPSQKLEMGRTRY